jgi:hypothetical protein
MRGTSHLLPGERRMPSSASSYSWMMCSSWGRKARVTPAITTCGSRHAARPVAGQQHTRHAALCAHVDIKSGMSKGCTCCVTKALLTERDAEPCCRPPHQDEDHIVDVLLSAHGMHLKFQWEGELTVSCKP